MEDRLEGYKQALKENKLEIDPDLVLRAQIGEYETVFVIGYDKDGELRLSGSIADGPELNWLLDEAKKRLFEACKEE